MVDPHRKLVKHFHEAGHVHELTFSCYRRMPLLTNDLWRGMLAVSIHRALQRHRYQLIAFVLMPEHVHLLVLPERDASTIPALLRAIKRPYSYQIKQILIKEGSSLLKQLTIRQRPGVTTLRYWQEGPGYDRNITDPRTLHAAINYIHNNPVKRELCGRAIDWRWSSARQLTLSESPADPLLPLMCQLPPGLDYP